MNLETLKKALKEALAAARAVKCDDGGTCNFDTCVLYAKGMQIKKLEAAIKEVDNHLHVSKWGAGEFHIYGYENGQANLRTSMVEAFEKVLRNYGFDTGVYYAMD